MSDEKDLEAMEDEAADAHEAHGTRTFLAGLAIGALVGAGVALLFAPKTGAQTRRAVSRQAKKLAREARERYDAMREKVKSARHHGTAGAEDDDEDDEG